MRYLATYLLLLLLAAAGGPALAQQAPVLEQPQPMMRSYLVYSEGLTITPMGELTLMRFSGGVRIEGRGLSLLADALELTLVGDALPLGKDLLEDQPLPGLPEALDNEEAQEDLGQIARELKLPAARFDSDSVRRLKAIGNVRFEGHGVLISTASVESSDGGQTWTGSGRTNLAMDSPEGSTRLSADGILLDTVSGTVTASGHISGSYRRTGSPESLELATSGCSFDMHSGVVSVPGEVRLEYGGIDMLISPQPQDESGAASVARELEPLVPALPAERLIPASAPPGVSIDLESRSLRARGSVQVSDPERGIELTALNLDYLMDEGLMTAWQVELSQLGEGMTLSAPLVEIFTAEKRLEASGMPELRYGSSSYTGERILVSEDADGVLVIEIEGQQLALLHMDELRDYGKEADAEPAESGNGDVAISSEKSSKQ
ncbi:MAG: hypothetical protein R3F46_01005 [bacterium]